MSRADNPESAAAVARKRAAFARERARRAHEHAKSQEAVYTRTGRALHRRIAATHRRIAALQLTSARLQESYARRIEQSPRQDPRSLFMTGVAESCGAHGAALTLVGQDPSHQTVTASDDTSRTAQELEFILAQGPARDSMDEGEPVCVTGHSAIEERWQAYGPQLTELGLASVTAIPLASTSACFGALTLYQPTPAPTDRTTCVEIANVVTQTVLLGPDPDPELYGGTDHRDIVYQASGAYAVRIGCKVKDALALINARAFVEGVSVELVAQDILTRRDSIF